MNVNFNKARVYQLDPSKKYLIVFDNRYITKDEALRVTEELGVEGVAIVVNESPKNIVKIIETQKEKEDEPDRS